ncbi:hypothetical protein EFA69_12740 [Rufibacter immobilis]|uniref:WD40 repeat domain-containing protein n=2 Tax=Rufibacter immobilis TaxID=1348778 RepID=A0A3M9MUP8_9BACT|nr:hypothetical protein EFA69_12740 [Rufibacter immobilis]
MVRHPKYLRLLPLAGLLMLCLFSLKAIAQKARPMEYLVCGDSKVLIVDNSLTKDSIPIVTWSWDAHDATDLPDDYRQKFFETVDDCKAYQKGSKILISSSSGGFAMLNKANKKVLYFGFVPNAHSIELLPGNIIAVAGSTAEKGNCIELYKLDKPGVAVYRDSLYSGHGVVWHSKQKKLYALGYNELRQYSLKNDKTGTSLTLDNSWKLPNTGGHDLQLVPSEEKLLITDTRTVWEFDLSSFSFSEFSPLKGMKNVKSVGKHPVSKQLIYTKAEESWWTYHVNFMDPNQRASFPEIRVYKARWISNE